MADYGVLCKEAASLISGVPHLTADLANLSALIFHSLERLNWAGFYLVESDKLILGPFQGRPACIEIPMGKGVCGAAAREDRAILVPDVNAFPGHIACDCASRSEIVIPLHKNGMVAAVLDIDSPEEGRFDGHDLTGLTALARTIESEIGDLL